VRVTSDIPGTYRPPEHYPPAVIVAATPAWFADNVAIIALVVLVLVTFLVLRLVKETVAKAVLLALIAAVAVLVYVNRDALETCAIDCECEVAARDLTVPFCDPDLNLTLGITPGPPRA
jgi:hypothetical protein